MTDTDITLDTDRGTGESEWSDHPAMVYWGRAGHAHGEDHDACVTYCRAPGQRRRGIRCPACYGHVVVRPVDSAGIEHVPGRAERFAAWCGGWAAAFADGFLFPFRLGRSHTEALVRDLLQEAMAAGLRAEVDGLADILTVLEGIEGELRAIRDATDAAGERPLCRAG